MNEKSTINGLKHNLLDKPRDYLTAFVSLISEADPGFS